MCQICNKSTNERYTNAICKQCLTLHGTTDQYGKEVTFLLCEETICTSNGIIDRECVVGGHNCYAIVSESKIVIVKSQEIPKRQEPKIIYSFTPFNKKRYSTI